jgi:(p)ppGpp synthase/HD superfamily hydrolase
MLNQAIEIAMRAHDGHKDKDGNPYIMHPLRVMVKMENETQRLCAVLHDVVEDSELTLEDLKKEGFAEDIIQVLDCLTKRKGEDYDLYIGRILQNDTACRVKLMDLEDNIQMTSRKKLSAKNIKKIEKYQEATARIHETLTRA